MCRKPAGLALIHKLHYWERKTNSKSFCVFPAAWKNNFRWFKRKLFFFFFYVLRMPAGARNCPALRTFLLRFARMTRFPEVQGDLSVTACPQTCSAGSL